MKLAQLIFLSILNAQAEDLTNHITRQDAFWGKYRETKLEDKILKAPPEIINYLTRDNANQAWPNKPVSLDLPHDLIDDTRNALLEIPEPLLKKISSKTVGIFFVEDLGGSAITDFTMDKKKIPQAGFVVIDKSALNRKANEWATWKESSPFSFDSKSSLSVTIESKKNNNRKNALQYILLHEFGHILNIGSPLLPIGERT